MWWRLRSVTCDDVTLRALDVLAADASPPRTLASPRPASHFGIAARTVSLHAHNTGRQRAQALDRALAAGESVALVTDAGTPAVNDPGRAPSAPVRAPGYPVVPSAGAVRGHVTAIVSVAGLRRRHVRVRRLPAAAAGAPARLDRHARIRCARHW